MEAIIIGAGHAGLAASQQLKQRGVEHLVLERNRIGDSWASLRWDSFALNTPTWMNRLPGETDADVEDPPDGFLTHHQWVDHLSKYAKRWDLPLREGVNVERVEPLRGGGGYRVRVSGASDETIECRSVIVASGVQNVPRIPPVAAQFPASISQLPALDYKQPDRLPPGAVLVVGAGQTGGQIVEELLAAGRSTYWSISAVTRVPRRYRGRDILEWFVEAGFYEAPVESITDPAMLTATMPIISGVGRYGHTLSLQWLADRGATLLGRIGSVDDGVLRLDDSVADCIAFGDQRSAEVHTMVDGWAAADGGPLPPHEPDEADEPHPDAAGVRSPDRLGLVDAGISSVIWATGVSGEFGFLPSECLDEHGQPRHDHGASPLDGIDFIGLPWLTRRGSGIINGIVADAEAIAERVAARTTASVEG